MIPDETLDWMLRDFSDVEDKNKDACNNINEDVVKKLAAQL